MHWFVFPAYNEKENLVQLLPKIHFFLKDKIRAYKIMIINDGSTDSTKNLKNLIKGSIPIDIISHEKNKGIGEVFKTAFSTIVRIGGNNDCMILMEADGTSDYTLIPELVSELESGNDVVIASRYAKGGAYKNFPLKRHIISLGANLILRTVFRNTHVKDYTIFYRGYRVSLLKKAVSRYGDRFITSKTFLANAEVLINLAKFTDNITEIPFVYSYDLKIGKSKMPLLKTLAEYVRFLIVKIFRSLP